MLDDRLHQLLQKAITEKDILKITTDYMYSNNMDTFSGTATYENCSYKMYVYRQQNRGTTYSGDSQ